MSKKNKRVFQQENVDGKKQIKCQEDPISYYKKSPLWSFKKLDNGYSKWGLVHAKNLNQDVIEKLSAYEKMIWDDIIKSSGGRSHGNNSHFENVSDLISEAQKRWRDLKLDEYDRVFSLRLSGLHRLYGIVDNGVFYIVWYDQDHEIYPRKK